MKVFVISDTHFPFVDVVAFDKMMLAIKKEKPTYIVQIGDLLDQYAFSKYTKSSSVYPDVEDGLVFAKAMWAAIRRNVPKAKCYQLLGNHDMRMAKRISEKLPELANFIQKDLYAFKGVKTLNSDRDFLVIDGVVYVHGWLSKSIDHARYFGKPTVHGHRHRPGIDYDTPRLWSMDVGFLADRTSIPLSYTASKHSRWTLACGIVEDGKPRLIILER